MTREHAGLRRPPKLRLEREFKSSIPFHSLRPNPPTPRPFRYLSLYSFSYSFSFSFRLPLSAQRGVPRDPIPPSALILVLILDRAHLLPHPLIAIGHWQPLRPPQVSGLSPQVSPSLDALRGEISGDRIAQNTRHYNEPRIASRVVFFAFATSRKMALSVPSLSGLWSGMETR